MSSVYESRQTNFSILSGNGSFRATLSRVKDSDSSYFASKREPGALPLQAICLRTQLFGDFSEKPQ